MLSSGVTQLAPLGGSGKNQPQKTFVSAITLGPALFGVAVVHRNLRLYALAVSAFDSR
jgi:hypothetical protein